MAHVTSPSTPLEGAVLVRVPASDQGWAAALPTAPGSAVVTVTVGHPSLVPVPIDDLVDGGYRIVGVASDRRPIGPCVDVLVLPQQRRADPDWFAALVAHAERVFDLRLGPVLRVLEGELDLHRRALATTGV